jgi:hypothetical protein
MEGLVRDLGALGSLCGVGDLKAIAMANQLCCLRLIRSQRHDDCFYECFEKGS